MKAHSAVHRAPKVFSIQLSISMLQILTTVQSNLIKGRIATSCHPRSSECTRRPQALYVKRMSRQCPHPEASYTGRAQSLARVPVPVHKSTREFMIYNTWFLGPTRVCPQTASRSVHPFRRAQHTDEHADHAT